MTAIHKDLPGSCGSVGVTLYPFICVRCQGHFYSGWMHTRMCSACRHPERGNDG